MNDDVRTQSTAVGTIVRGTVIMLFVAALAGCGAGPFGRTEATAPPAGAPLQQTANPTSTPALELDVEELAGQSGARALQRSYTGDVRAVDEVAVLPQTSGQIEAVNVSVGDSVAAGDVLFELDHEVLDAQVAQAEAGLAAAEAGVEQAKAALAAADANLAQAQKEPKASEREAARTGFEAAQAAYDRLLNSPTVSDLIPIETQLRQAEAAVKQAQAAYDQIKWRDDAAAFPQALQLEQATLQYEAAKAQYDEVIDGPEESQLKQAEAQLAQARANWERVQEGTPAETIAAAEAQVAQARAGLAAANAQLEQARAALELARIQRDNAFVTAPINGQVARVNAEIGVLASPQQPQPLVLLISNAVEIDFSLDEALVSRTRAGDDVVIQPDAFPDQTIPGHITRVSPIVDPATRTVQVFAEPDRQDGTLRPGMSVTVTLVE